MGLVTDFEQKALTYVRGRKTPPSVAEVALHLMTSRQAAARFLTSLARKRRLISFMERIPGDNQSAVTSRLITRCDRR